MPEKKIAGKETNRRGRQLGKSRKNPGRDFHQHQAGGDRPGHSGKPLLLPGESPGGRDPQRLVHGACLHGPGPDAGRLGQDPNYCGTKDLKIVTYLSAEFLEGPHLGNNLINLGIREQVRQAVTELGLDLETLLRQEPEPGLGNGGLGQARRLLHGLSRDAPGPGDRVRYPVRIRHLRPGDPGRLAGGKDRQVAAPRQPLGDSAGPRSPIT